MDRVIVNEGTKVDLYNLFEDLQDYNQNNFLKVIDLLIESYGVNADTAQNGSIVAGDTSLKVTNIGGFASYVNIGAGEALTSGLHYIHLSTPTTYSTAGLSDGYHTLYLRHAYTYSDPVDVMSGFAIGLLGGSQKNSRMHDSYDFVWDTNPLTSGIALAVVISQSSGNLINVALDSRPSNVLKLKNAILSEDVVRKSELATQTLLGNLILPSISVTNAPHDFTITTGTGINTLTGSEAMKLKAWSHLPNTDTYTNSSTFYIGGDSTTGHEVITLAGEPLRPLNFRVTDVDSATRSSMRDAYYTDNKLALAVKTGLISHGASVSLAWNWDECSLASVYTTGRIDISLSPGVTAVNANELVGYHLWVPGASMRPGYGGVDYIITANDASIVSSYGSWTLLTVTPYDHTVDINTIANINTITTAIVHSNAERYEVVAIPMRAGVLAYDDRHENIVSYAQVPTAMRTKIEYPLGEILRLGVRAVSIGHDTHYTVIQQQGSFTKPDGWKSPVYYNTDPSNPYGFLVQIPDIDPVGASISAFATPVGFQVIINGWGRATDYELVWSTATNGADFNNIRTLRMVSSAKTIDISTPGSYRYYISVRPLISGQAVAAPLTASVTSGAGGQDPVAYQLLIPIKVKTYSGTMSTYSTLVESWAVTGIVSPAGSTITDVFTDALEGEIITITPGAGVSTDYVIGSVVGGTHLSIANLQNEEVKVGLTGTFTISTSKFGREIYNGLLSNGDFDIIITKIEVNQFSQPGFRSGTYFLDHPVLRVYPAAQENEADTLVLTQFTAATYSQDVDIPVSAVWGNRIVKVDLWDDAPGTNSNKIGLVADLKLHWRAMSVREYTDIAGKGGR